MVFVALGLVLGIILARSTDFDILPQFITPIIIIGILIIWKLYKSYPSIVILSIILGFSAYNNYNREFSRTLLDIRQFSDQKIDFTGLLINEDTYISGQRLTIENIEFKTTDVQFENNVKYYVYPKSGIITDISIGDTVSGSGKFLMFLDRRNPGEFDLQKMNYVKQIAGKIYASDELLINKNDNYLLRERFNRFRQSVRSKLIAYSDHETAALLAALILGDRSQIDQDLRESFANVGVIHVLAVSGLHVGYVLIILMLLAKILRIPWGWDKLFITLGLVVFTLLSGGKASVIRASLMAVLYIFAPLFNRRPNAWNIIALAAFLILIFNPNYLFELGFQLSFAAVISIIYFYNLLNKILPKILQVNNMKQFPVRFFWGLFLVSLSAQIGTIPIIAYYFGRIPLIAIIANLFVIPLIGGFVAMGFAKLFLFWLPALVFFIDQISWLLKEFIQKIISLFDQFPYASINFPHIGWLHLFLYLVLIMFLLFLLKRKYNYSIILFLLFINAAIYPWVFQKSSMDIICLDLGSQESTIIRKDNQKSLLINVGIFNQFSNDVVRKIVPAATALNIHKFTWLLRSSGNSFHHYAYAKAIETIPTDTVLSVQLDSNSAIDNHFLNLLTLKEANFKQIQRGNIINIDEGTYLQFFLPIDKMQKKEAEPLAYKLQHGLYSILFIEKLNEAELDVLINDGKLLKSDILKLSYPKKLPSNFDEFIQIVAPKMVVISGRKTSKYNPSTAELNNLIDSKIMYTDSLGAVWLNSTGTGVIKVKNWK